MHLKNKTNNGLKLRVKNDGPTFISFHKQNKALQNNTGGVK